MKITELNVRNFIGIEEISIEPKKLNIISGGNGKGKTSVIEAIHAAFRGADAGKIRLGANKAEIFLSTDEFHIKRSITARGNNAQVTDKDGKILPRPQTFLDGIIGDFNFEPVKFFQMSSKEQTGYLLKAIPCKVEMEQLENWSYGLLTAERLIEFENMHGLEAVSSLVKELYDKRHAINAQVRTLESAIIQLKGNMPAGIKNKPPDTTKINDLMDRISNARAQQEKLINIENRTKSLNDDIDSIEKQICELLKRKETKLQEVSSLQQEIINVDIEDTAALQDELAELQKAQGFQRELIRLEDMQGELKTARQQADVLDLAVKTLQTKVPAELMSRAKMPIKGLDYESGQFNLNGIPIDNLSSSEKARLAVAITRKLNEKYPVKAICLDGFEALDTSMQKAFLSEAGKDDFQYFVTKVSDSPKIEVDMSEFD